MRPPSRCPSPSTHMWLSQARMLLPIVNVLGIIYIYIYIYRYACVCARVFSLPSTLPPAPFEIDTAKAFGAGR